MTLLSLVQSATPKIGIPKPVTVVDNSDVQVETLLELANQEGQELARAGHWEALVVETTFTAVAQSEQTNAMPSDFVGFIDGSFFNRSSRRRVFGPISPQQWQREQATSVAAGIHDFFRVRGGNILITPDPTAGDTMAFEYGSTFWVDTDGDGDGDSETWDADDNTSLLEERLMSLGLIWRFLDKSGLPYETKKKTYDDEVEKALARQGGAPILSLSGGGGIFLGPPNVPEVGYG